MEKILIAGATGSTGKRIIEILNNSQSFDPVAMIRKEEQKTIFDDMEVKWVLADLEGDVSEAVKGVDKIIFAAGSGGSTGPEKTDAVDRDGAIKLIDAAKKAKVKKFIMLSSMGADDPAAHEELKHYLEAKAAADEHLRKSKLKYTILRPGRLTDDMGLGKVNLAEKLDDLGEIPRDDVAFLLIMSLADPLLPNMTVEAIEGEEPIKSAMIELSRG
ncbi:SDR family oxidoreductase [Salinimicrobium gaetbulicola]|uniref:SDR family oxidoreductase n=1 Tax=Salinimicrobium gaetbulicola TaxID=999702 RepID=A0ABW3IG46_9FLAO